VDWMQLTQGLVVGPCEHGNEIFGFTESGNFLTDWLLISPEGLCPVKLAS
jgi:hypothetical protein